MKYFKLSGLILALFLLYRPVPISAATIFIDDTFTDANRVNMAQTTAEVDTANGWVTLTQKTMANSLVLYEDSYDITVINGGSIETYHYDGFGMTKKTEFSVSGLNNPVSISSWNVGEYIVADQGTQTATYYNFDGTSMAAHPFLTVSGLISPLSVSAVKNTYDYVVLDDQEVKYYSFDGTGMVLNNFMSVNLGASLNPVSMAVSSDGCDYAVIDKAANQVKYYSFEDSGMALNPVMSIAAGELTKPRSIAMGADAGSYLVIDGDSVKAFNSDGSTMIHNTILSVSGIRKPMAVAVKPDSYDYAVLHHDSDDHLMVSYFAFTGTDMEEITEFRITGLDDLTYGNDQMLMGKEVTSAEAISGLKIIAEVELPAGTSIEWEVTVDGLTWLAAINNGPEVKFGAAGNKPNYRAILHTDDPMITPKILSVRLVDASLWIGAFRIIDIVGPEISENPDLPSSAFPIFIWAGYNVAFEIDTTGKAESVAVDITVTGDVISLSSLRGELTPRDPPGNNLNTWTGTFYTNVMTPVGTLLDIDLAANKGGNFAYVSYPEFAEIYGSALEHHQIHLTH